MRNSLAAAGDIAAARTTPAAKPIENLRNFPDMTFPFLISRPGEERSHNRAHELSTRSILPYRGRLFESNSEGGQDIDEEFGPEAVDPTLSAAASASRIAASASPRRERSRRYAAEIVATRMTIAAK